MAKMMMKKSMAMKAAKPMKMMKAMAMKKKAMKVYKYKFAKVAVWKGKLTKTYGRAYFCVFCIQFLL